MTLPAPVAPVEPSSSAGATRPDSYAIVNAKRGSAESGKPRHLTRHTIADLSYPEDRLDCSCGAQMRAVGAVDWPKHKRSVGEPVSLSVILGPAKARKALRVA